RVTALPSSLRSAHWLLLVGRSPNSTLFPYTTLFRSGRRPLHLRRRPGGPAGRHLLRREPQGRRGRPAGHPGGDQGRAAPRAVDRDRKSTRLNSSHVKISYAVFCLKKKKRKIRNISQK